MRPFMTRLGLALVLAHAGVACGGDEGDTEPPTSTSSPEGPASPSAAPAELPLISHLTPVPDGFSFAPSDATHWTGVSVPTGEAWSSNRMPNGMSFDHDESGISVMLQRQARIPADMRAEYGDSFVQVNQRDADGYEVVDRSEGTISSAPATKVDGTFNNGAAMTTRDYLVFAGGSVSTVMVRGPVEQEATVRAIADHIASTVGR